MVIEGWKVRHQEVINGHHIAAKPHALTAGRARYAVTAAKERFLVTSAGMLAWNVLSQLIMSEDRRA